jgi:hypothetical protein
MVLDPQTILVARLVALSTCLYFLALSVLQATFVCVMCRNFASNSLTGSIPTSYGSQLQQLQAL